MRALVILLLAAAVMAACKPQEETQKVVSIQDRPTSTFSTCVEGEG